MDRDSLNSLTSSERRGHDPHMPMSRGRLVDMEGQGADHAPALHLAQGPGPLAQLSQQFLSPHSHF